MLLYSLNYITLTYMHSWRFFYNEAVDAKSRIDFKTSKMCSIKTTMQHAFWFKLLSFVRVCWSKTIKIFGAMMCHYKFDAVLEDQDHVETLCLFTNYSAKKIQQNLAENRLSNAVLWPGICFTTSPKRSKLWRSLTKDDFVSIIWLHITSWGTICDLCETLDRQARLLFSFAHQVSF